MSLILNIDTSLEVASVVLAERGNIIMSLINVSQKDHAQFVHSAIKRILEETGKNASALDAIAVAIGPGSYTGLRVGMATAKGLCYAWQKPMIGISNLAIISHSAKTFAATMPQSIICPMIDARRMEVFTALYNQAGECLLTPHALILTSISFENELNQGPVVFSGNGSDKFKTIINHPNAFFHQADEYLSSMVLLSQNNFDLREFSNIHLSEPLYVKEHESMIVKMKG